MAVKKAVKRTKKAPRIEAEEPTAEALAAYDDGFDITVPTKESTRKVFVLRNQDTREIRICYTKSDVLDFLATTGKDWNNVAIDLRELPTELLYGVF